MDQIQPAASQYRGDEPISGGMKALMLIISILFCPIGSLIAWVYGARNADRPGATLVRLVGMIFTIISIMGGLVFGAAVLMIPGFLTQRQDQFLTQSPVSAPPAASATAKPDLVPVEVAESPEIQAKKAELKAVVGKAVAAYYDEHKSYATLEELNAAGLLDERFANDPVHPEEGYVVQLKTWTSDGKPGCDVTIKYTGSATPGMDIAAAVGEVKPDDTAPQQAATAAEPAQDAAAGTAEQTPPPHRGSGKRGAARWKQFM
jgi:hypothetical protein